MPETQVIKLPPELRLVVITRNSARWFAAILDAYERLGISPFVILDASSDDGTEQLLRGRGVEYARHSPEVPSVEWLTKFIPDHVRSEWALRLDDDELPSRFLCAWLQARLSRVDHDVIGVQRRWIRLGAEGRCEYSRHELVVMPLGGMDIQWRLFRPGRVRYRQRIHTPGFDVPEDSLVLPPSAYIAHFNWVVRSAHERRLQLEDYDRVEPNAGSRFREIKVWEDAPEGSHRFYRLESDEFDQVAAALASTA